MRASINAMGHRLEFALHLPYPEHDKDDADFCFQSREILLTGRRKDEQIVRIAERAYLDMVAANNADHEKYKFLKLPNVVSVIVKGHSAYISSSMKGKSLS